MQTDSIRYFDTLAYSRIIVRVKPLKFEGKNCGQISPFDRTFVIDVVSKLNRDIIRKGIQFCRCDILKP
jgi:hypothetical protein